MKIKKNVQSSLGLKEARSKIVDLLKERGWNQFDPLVRVFLKENDLVFRKKGKWFYKYLFRVRFIEEGLRTDIEFYFFLKGLRILDFFGFSHKTEEDIDWVMMQLS